MSGVSSINSLVSAALLGKMLSASRASASSAASGSPYDILLAAQGIKAVESSPCLAQNVLSSNGPASTEDFLALTSQ